MNKKALIVGIADYGDAQPPLTAPENEVEAWSDLLIDSYDFPAEDVRLLLSPRATKLAITERLEWLLADAAYGDQLVFVFCGHGARLRRRHPNGKVLDNMDEAIVAYPEAGRSIEEYAMYDDDLVRIAILSRLPARVSPTFILDCCFGGGLATREKDQKSVFIPLDIAHRAAAGPNVRIRFGECRRVLSAGQEPVIMAAVPTLEQSPTGTFGGKRRTTFGYNTIKQLQGDKQQSYRTLRDSVHQAMQIEEAPVLSGNETRFDKPFLN
jgi:hypothetical protein